MRQLRQKRWPAAIALGAMLGAQSAMPMAFAGGAVATPTTPIKHVIVLIGENHTFDNIFATYVPRTGQTVENLLSEGIINSDGSPGPDSAIAQQSQVNTPLPSTYFVSSTNKSAYAPFLPTPQLNGAPNVATSLAQIEANPTGVSAPFDGTVTAADLMTLEPSLETPDLGLLRTGATGLAGTTGLDTRVTNGSALPKTVFQWTGATLHYDSYNGDQVHRLFHTWQQSDCSIASATRTNPSGCLNDLYPFVGMARDDSGGNSLGFFNMQQGDAPLLKQLADRYTMSDNFHQSIMGGTAANHMGLGTSDAISWTTFNGLTIPPSSGIANPNPISSTSDKYTADQAWTNCSDTTQPGIASIVSYLGTLPYNPSPNCASGNYYMINNLSPGFLPNGTIDTANITSGAKVPPSPRRTIGDELNDNSVTWAYYGGGYNAAVRVADGSTDPFTQLIGKEYCDICNFESYTTSIMGDSTQRKTHIKDATDFFKALSTDHLPAVAFVKPDSFLDGHPASSKLDSKGCSRKS
jgi:phospholipase C